MKISVSCQVFHPDHSGIALYSSDFALYAAKKGHEVSVITGFPFYPSWRKRKEDRRKLFRKDRVDNVTIYRGYTYAKPNPSTVTRLIQEFFLLIFSFINYVRAGRPDVIVVFTTPVSFGLLAYLFKIIWGCKLIINVQDFQVEAASSLKMVKSNIFVKILSKIEKISYAGADMVTSISDSMIQLLEKKGVKKDKVEFWPNWIDVNAMINNQSGEFRSKYNIPSDKKIIGYAGNVGLKQGLSILIDLANEFKSNDDLIFLIIGEGSGLKDLKEYAQNIESTNLRFLPFLSPAEYQDFLNETELVFISQVKTESDIYFPSKLLGIMAKGKAILLSADKESELYNVLNTNEVAFVTEYGDLHNLKEILTGLLNEESKRLQVEAKAKSFVKRFDKEIVLNEILEKTEKIL